MQAVRTGVCRHLTQRDRACGQQAPFGISCLPQTPNPTSLSRQRTELSIRTSLDASRQYPPALGVSYLPICYFHVVKMQSSYYSCSFYRKHKDTSFLCKCGLKKSLKICSFTSDVHNPMCFQSTGMFLFFFNAQAMCCYMAVSIQCLSMGYTRVALASVPHGTIQLWRSLTPMAPCRCTLLCMPEYSQTTFFLFPHVFPSHAHHRRL